MKIPPRLAAADEWKTADCLRRVIAQRAAALRGTGRDYSLPARLDSYSGLAQTVAAQQEDFRVFNPNGKRQSQSRWLY